jgi:hypothetical protein
MPVAAEHAGGGPVYFAWVDPDETTFGSEHHRYDDYIFRLEIDEEEGKLAIATVDMKNPGSLLAPGRKRWCWIAFDDGDGNVVPKFFGRVIGVPTSMFGEVVTIVFEARPLDYLARKQAVAETLKVAPYYDALFVDPAYLDDPDHILEGYSASWHYDPVTHEVSITDYLVGEVDGVEFLGADIVYDSLTFDLGDPPLRAVKMDASVTWTQQATGTIDLGVKLFSSFLGQGLFNSWPQQGANIGSGWSVAAASMIDAAMVNSAFTQTFSYSWKNEAKEHANGDAMSINVNYTKANFFGPVASTGSKEERSFVTGDPETGRAGSSSVNISASYILMWLLRATLVIRYDAKRPRTEHFNFTLSANLQPMLTDSDGTDDIETLVLNGGDVGVPLAGETEPPIGDTSRRSFFTIEDRGKQAREYAINVARAHILSKCRVVSSSWTATNFATALAMSLKMTARAHDARRLPGGSVLGKVVKIKLLADGDSGELSGTISIKSAIGYGEAVEGSEGEPTYVDADVIGADGQVFSGRFIALPSGDIGYSPPVDAPVDDGLVFPLTYEQAVVRDAIVFSEFIAPGDPPGPDLAAVGGAGTLGTIEKRPTSLPTQSDVWYELELKPVTNGPFETSFDEIVVGPLSVPAQTNLEAA